MPALAQRLDRVPVAASVQMTIKARALRAEGKDVISLTVGEPNFDTPPHAIEALEMISSSAASFGRPSPISALRSRLVITHGFQG